MFEDIIIGDAPFWVVIYYFIMWFVNATAYVLATVGMYSLSRLLPASRFHRGFLRLSFLCGVFAFIRTLSGLDSLVRFFSGFRSSTQTIEYLGIVSLFLNTSFVMTLAIVVLIEVSRLRKLDLRRRQLIIDTIEAHEDLKSVSDEIHLTEENK